MKKYELLEVIGDGTYCTVYKGTFIESGERVAIKKLKTKYKSWQECLDLREVKALSKLNNHINVVKLKEVVRESNSEVFFIFEWAEKNLYEYMDSFKKQNKSIPESKIKDIVLQIANGLSYMHSNGYFHRDLKPENILMVGDTVKIADLGLARESNAYYNTQLTDYVCTRWYRAPENVMRSSKYSNAVDIWSLGTIMAELFTLTPLFPGTSEFDQLCQIVNIIGSPKFNDWPDGYKYAQKLGIKFPNSQGKYLGDVIKNASPEALNLLNEIFVWDSSRRPTSKVLSSHSYLTKINMAKPLHSLMSNYYSNSSSHFNPVANYGEVSPYLFLLSSYDLKGLLK